MQKKQKQKQKQKPPQCGNIGEQILLNEPRKHWPQYMDNGFAHLQNDIFFHRRCMKLIWVKPQCPSQSPLSYWIT